MANKTEITILPYQEFCSYCKKDKVSSIFKCEECEYQLCQKCFDDGKGRICWTDTDLCEICDPREEEEWCDCCSKSWVDESDPDDLCHCCCSKCHSLLRDCRYTCYENDA